jgi:hypothetical protein
MDLNREELWMGVMIKTLSYTLKESRKHPSHLSCEELVRVSWTFCRALLLLFSAG